MQTLFLVFRDPGPAWVAGVPTRLQPLWEEHAAFVDRLFEDGRVFMAGPYADYSRALVIVNARDATDASALFDDDPWTGAGILVEGEVIGWTVFLDSHQLRQPSPSVDSSNEGPRVESPVRADPARAMRTLERGRITLEPQTAAHAEAMFAVLADPAIYTYENTPPPSLDWLRARFARLESRCSPDGSELWLNWVVRLLRSELIGYVQATVRQDGSALIAYEFASAFWGRGLAREAAEALMRELGACYQVRSFAAIAQGANTRSLGLLQRLGFVPAAPAVLVAHHLEPGEVLLTRVAPSP